MKNEILDLFMLNRDEYSKRDYPHLMRNLSSHYVAVTGSGEPFKDAFVGAAQELVVCVEAIKKKKAGEQKDFLFPKIEGLFGDVQNLETDLNTWQLMIRVPFYVSQSDVDAASPTGSVMHLEIFKEGLCIQTCHTSGWDTLDQSVQAVREFALEKGFKVIGRLHMVFFDEITDPNKSCTLVRMPVNESIL